MMQPTNIEELAEAIRKALVSFIYSGLNEDLGNAEALAVYRGLCQASEALEAHISKTEAK